MPPKPVKKKDIDGPELSRDEFIVFSYKKTNIYQQKLSEYTKELIVKRPELTPKERIKLAQQMYRDWKGT